MVVNARFIISAANKSQFIKTEKPVIAVCGKSNVGKSSFINALANRKKLAKVSKDPGRTRLINYFDMGGFVLADLPGYGYAKVSKQEKLKWAELLEDFFAEPAQIAHVFSLVDIRHNPTGEDIQMVEFLSFRIMPFTVIATKSDKLSRAQINRSLINIAAVLKCGAGNIIPVSSQTKSGYERVFEKIGEILNPDV